MRREALLAVLLLAPLPAAAQSSTAPAQMGVTPQTTPEVLQVLDNTKTWVNIGNVNSTTHWFHPVGGEADIMVTDVGMAAGGQDNAPFIQTLMNKMGTPPTAGGYDVTFPSVPGQNYTEYYFAKPLLLSRSANFHCAGPPNGTGSSVTLVFAPGVHGVIQEDGHYTSDGGYAGGVVDGCRITSMGFATGTANPGTATTLTGVTFQGDPLHVVPSPTWSVGDGVVVVPTLGGFFPDSAILTVPPGTTVTAVAGTTLTLSNPVAQSLGSTPHATAAFTQTGSNNFVNNDTITVGNSAYKFVTTLGSTANNVEIGVDFPTSAANLIAAIKNTAGQMQTYVPQPRSTTAVYPQVTAAYASGVITFTTLWGGPDSNTYPSVYTAAGTAAGTFAGATFSGATASNQTVALYQLPLNQAFTIQTTTGSNSALVTGGPRLLVPGELVWSDAFPFGTTVHTVSGTLGNQTVALVNAYITVNANATATHPSGSPGQLWVLPAALKRDVQAKSSNNYFTNFPIGLEMACNSNFFNCTGSRDEGNWTQATVVGRWVSSNNTSASGAINEAFARNFMMDVFEGASLGSVYVNLNTNSFEGGFARYGFLMNCANQNSSVIFGGYLTGSSNSCANATALIPPYAGGPVTFGPQAAFSNGVTYSSSKIIAPGALSILSGNDSLMCLGFGGPPAANTTLLSLGLNGCGTTSTWNLGWNNTINSFDLYPAFSTVAVLLRLISTGAGFNGGYIGNAGSGTAIELPGGVLLNNPEGQGAAATTSRYLAMGSALPTGAYHLRGDVQFNSNASLGGSAGWISTAGSASFTGTIAGANLTMPSVTAGAVAIGQTVTGAGVTAGTKITAGSGLSWTVTPSQTVGPVAMTAASWTTFGPISNDPANPDYTATTIRSGSSANKDLTGRVTLSGGAATYTLVGTYVSAPNCLTADVTTPANASSVSESVTALAFTGTGSDVIKYICAGRN